MNSKLYTRKHFFFNSCENPFQNFFQEKFSKLQKKNSISTNQKNLDFQRLPLTFQENDSLFLLFNFHHISPLVNKKIQSLLYTLDSSFLLQNSKGYQDFFLQKSFSKKGKQFSFEKKKKMQNANNDLFFKGQGRFLAFSKKTLHLLQDTLQLLQNPPYTQYIVPLAVYSKGKIYDITCIQQFLLPNILQTRSSSIVETVSKTYILHSITNIQQSCIGQQQYFLFLLKAYEEKLQKE